MCSLFVFLWVKDLALFDLKNGFFAIVCPYRWSPNEKLMFSTECKGPGGLEQMRKTCSFHSALIGHHDSSMVPSYDRKLVCPEKHVVIWDRPPEAQDISCPSSPVGTVNCTALVLSHKMGRPQVAQDTSWLSSPIGTVSSTASLLRQRRSRGGGGERTRRSGTEENHTTLTLTVGKSDTCLIQCFN